MFFISKFKSKAVILPPPYLIKVEDLEVEITRKKIKSIRLSIYRSTSLVKVSAPLKISESIILKFISSKLAWIKKQQKKWATYPVEPIYDYLSGELHFYQGTAYMLQVLECSKRPCVKLEENGLSLYIHPNSSVAQRKKILNLWYRRELLKEAPALFEKWQAKIGVEISDWRLRQMKTKWGSCNVRDKRICLNMELIKKPLCCLEYIIVHELVHLLERHHNARFYRYMDQFFPDWKECEKKLNP